MEDYLKPYKWTYLKETVFTSNLSKQNSGHFRITNGISKPTEDASRVFRDVMSYVYANNDYQGGTLLNISNFKTLYPFVCFDLTKQKMDIKDGVTKLSFHYELSGATATDYIIYGVVLHEQEAEIEKEGGKLLLIG